MKENRSKVILFSAFLLLFCVLSSCTKKDSEQKADMRGLADTVGFALNPEQIEAVVAKSVELERDSLNAEKKLFTEPWVGGICPHDDHVYAGRVYVHLLQNIRAKRIILFGVGHKAWRWGVKNRIIFDDFKYWRGPYKPVPVMTEIRQQIISSMDTSFYLVSNEFQTEEHSIEGIVPFLQYYNRDVEILPIIVPYMHWSRMDSLASALASIVNKIIIDRGWQLGKDIAFIISNDCVHYGDEGWGGKNYAPFGSDKMGFHKAVSREYNIIDKYLTGEIRQARLKAFLYNMVEKDLFTYRIPWCGRFSVPFGLDFMYHLTNDMECAPLKGTLLRYGTSYNLGRMDIGMKKPGVTAPRSLHHWVGYTTIGYK